MLLLQPCEIACLSHVEGGDVYFDDRSSVISVENIYIFFIFIIRGLKFGCGINVPMFSRGFSNVKFVIMSGADLNRGFESFIEKRGTYLCQVIFFLQ
jgi:hypothetical protein